MKNIFLKGRKQLLRMENILLCKGRNAHLVPYTFLFVFSRPLSPPFFSFPLSLYILLWGPNKENLSYNCAFSRKMNHFPLKWFPPNQTEPKSMCHQFYWIFRMQLHEISSPSTFISSKVGFTYRIFVIFINYIGARIKLLMLSLVIVSCSLLGTSHHCYLVWSMYG